MPVADDLHKETGNLIRAADWNALAAAVDQVRTDLTKKITDVETNLKALIDNTVTPLQTAVNQLQTDFGQFQTRVNGILSQSARVTLQATKGVYAIGEIAEITVQVTDIEGNPFTLGGG